MKLYKDMTDDEKLKWVTDFSHFTTDTLPRLERLGDVWELSDRKDIETGLKLIQAFQFAYKFAKTSLMLGDYSRRVSRLRYYVEQIKDEISKGMTVQGMNGETYAYIPALQRRARRGRPTKEAALQREQRKKELQSADTRTQEKIAALLGMTIITDKEAREKNNDELAAERAEREAEEAKIAPSLFDTTPPASQTKADTSSATQAKAPTLSADATNDKKGTSTNEVNKQATKQVNDEATNNESVVANNDGTSALDSMSLSASLHLDQVKWLLSAPLQADVDNVRNMRATATAAAERAKLMAQQGGKPEEVAVYAQQATDATKQYETVYENVDRELAKVWLRLRYDEQYQKEMADRYKIDENGKVRLLSLLKPYHRKVTDADPMFETSVRQWIDDNNPEAVARRQAAAERKAKADAIIKYLRRTDKQPTKTRIAGMQEKLKELATLIGDDEAKAYQPFIDKTIEDNKAYEQKKAAKKQKK